MNTSIYKKRVGTYDNGHLYKEYIKITNNSSKRETVIEDYRDRWENKKVRIQFWDKDDCYWRLQKTTEYHLDLKGIRKKVVSEYFNG